jgi:hypothetical protein
MEASIELVELQTLMQQIQTISNENENGVTFGILMNTSARKPICTEKEEYDTPRLQPYALFSKCQRKPDAYLL